MKYALSIIGILSLTILSCKSGKKEKGFEIIGNIINNSGKMVYLEETPMTTMQAVIVDSVLVDKDGKYRFKVGERESIVFNLRLDKSNYPFAAVINDTEKMTVNVTFSPGNKEFPEKYEVQGSPASSQMKDFMFAFNGQLQGIFLNDKALDSLRRAGAADSAVSALGDKRIKLGEQTRALSEEFIKKSVDPALTMFVLGYYQTTANNPNYQLPPFDNEEVNEFVNDLVLKFPDHKGVAAIAKSLAGKKGMMAPEFAMQDPKGNAVKLSSFRGKYVLVDFWASWCLPCRGENPNLVKAYNKFRDKNFTILGVSLEKPGEKDKWLKAVNEDQLTWDHVSDLMEWNSPVVALYQIEGIPYNVLVDPSGKIIAEKLFGDKLDKKLAEVLK